MRKRIKQITRGAAAALAAVLIFSMAGCGSEENTVSNTASQAESSAVSGSAVTEEAAAGEEQKEAAKAGGKDAAETAEADEKETAEAAEADKKDTAEAAEADEKDSAETAEADEKDSAETAEADEKDSAKAAEADEKKTGDQNSADDGKAEDGKAEDGKAEDGKDDPNQKNPEQDEEKAEGYDVLAEENEFFSSEKMGFSFLYSSDWKKTTEEDGSARIRIGSDSSLDGLTVSMTEPSDEQKKPQELLEESAKEAQEKYKENMTEQPVFDTLDWEGHNLSCLLYSYKTKDGAAVDCGEYIETAGSRYIIYRTEVLQSESGLASEALALAVVSLHDDPEYYQKLNETKS